MGAKSKKKDTKSKVKPIPLTQPLWEELVQRHPEVLEGAGVKYGLNEPIELFRGILSVKFGDKGAVSADGVVRLQWLPTPRLTFTLFSATRPPFHLGDVTISWAALASPIRGVVTGIETSGKASEPATHSMSGIIQGSGEEGTSTALGKVSFLLVNFAEVLGAFVRGRGENASKAWAARISLDLHPWRVVIDQRDDLKPLARSAREQRGFVLTHAVEVARIDGAAFSVQSVRDFLMHLRLLLSFARGSHVGFALLKGHDSSGQIVWREYQAPHADSWSTSRSWFPTRSPRQLGALAPGFFVKLSHAQWRETFGLALQWYLESAGPALPETSVILTQVALEALSWTGVVEEGLLTHNGFDALPASDKLRLLLFKLRIPNELPTHLEDLATAGEKLKWADGPHAITEIRNSIVHSNPKKRSSKGALSGGWIARDARTLGLWYLELALLALSGYTGTYADRRPDIRHTGTEELVPWSSLPPSPQSSAS